MEIIYPPLVEQSVKYHLQANKQETVNKAEIYRAMVERGILTENGQPTDYALKNGWIKDFYEEEDLSFEMFLDIFPIFKSYDAGLFQIVDGFWEIPVQLKKELLDGISQGIFSYDEKIQIEEYLADR
ncbi:hypothetical protein [Tetragenococcus muriaticus]|uniref:Uncharacterized protein n=2 Tax=Tetragenococcus muriaticus TaxID=64642 RepID=A0A091C4F5_9ENTE|nr:hypothetical protein [Tetragenococcus muriaticus]KFN91565.1 hypothetical protein TMU3MR103_0967 [Tetragenococcus muriaticus 3MR10-3]GMA46640.1 hypothetical protein GCM10025854_08900 [Tetragenococcus muriaticus]